jgi:hypothetical protein
MAGISGLQKTPGGSAERKKSGGKWMNAGPEVVVGEDAVWTLKE